MLFTTTFFACTVKKEVPKVVKNTFAKMFPEARSVAWNQENPSEWEAEFKMNGMEYSANFITDGTWKETEHEIDQNEVPQQVMAVLKKEYSDYKIKESEIAETAHGMVYEFEVKQAGKKIEVAIDNNGKILKREKAQEDNGMVEEND